MTISPFTSAGAATSPPRDTLQKSREQVALRWPALRALSSYPDFVRCTTAPLSQEDTAICVVVSLAGGVGKTTLTAALAQALSAAGERVQLADLANQGVLAYHFAGKPGDRDRPPMASEGPGMPGQARPEAGPEQTTVVGFHGIANATDGPTESQVAQLFARCRACGQRLMIDGGSIEALAAKPWVLAQMLRQRALFLVPVAPDTGSVLSLYAVERRLWELAMAMPWAKAQPALQLRFVLNQFESSQPLHLDVRHVLEDLLGESLLPITIRRSPLVAEALAEHKTALEYAPDSGVAADYRALAAWLRWLPPDRQRTATNQPV